MKIAVDARNLINPTTGISRYLAETVRAMRKLGAELTLYLPVNPNHKEVEDLEALFDSAQAQSIAARQIWGQTRLPNRVRHGRADIFWGPAHRLPMGLKSHIPTVLTIHDLVWRDAKATMKLGSYYAERFLMPLSLARATHIVTVSKATEIALSTYKPELKTRITTIYPGHQNWPPPSRLPFEGPFVLAVGTIEPRKNIPLLLEAFSQLNAEEKKGHRLVIAGRVGWKHLDIMALASQLNLENEIIYIEAPDDALLAALYEGCRFLAFPSFYEGFGLPIIEAQSFGKPVICAPYPPMTEIGGEGVYGADPLSVTAWKEALAKLIGDHSFCERLGNAGYINSQKYNWEHTAKLMLNLFEGVCK